MIPPHPNALLAQEGPSTQHIYGYRTQSRVTGSTALPAAQGLAAVPIQGTEALWVLPQLRTGLVHDRSQLRARLAEAVRVNYVFSG